MNSLPTEKDEGITYIIKKSGTSTGLAVALLAGLILLAFYFWLTYATIDSIVVENQITSQEQIIKCAVGQCAMDIVSGEKICPEIGSLDGLSYNPVTQLCVNPKECSGAFPYAVLSDGSTDQLGLCGFDPLTEERQDCRCSRVMSCPYYITTVFSSISGNPYTSLQGTRTAFSQLTSSPLGGTLQRGISGDLVFSDPNTTFCTVPMSWLLRSNPGCASFSNEDPNDIPLKCLNLNPCLRGRLAYIAESATNFSKDDLYNITLGCVSAKRLDGSTEECPSNTYTVYDKGAGGIVCV